MYKIGIDFGGTNLAVGLVDDQNKIVAKTSVPTNREGGIDRIVADMAECCRDVVAQVGASLADVSMVGVASPGAINSTTGTIEYYSGMDVINYPLADKLRAAVGVSNVRAENDANAAALAEAVAGAAEGSQHSITVALGTGVGGGIIIDGKVYAGFNYSAAELGHMVIVHGGLPCSCGRLGCWESYSSATALIAKTKQAMDASPQSKLHAVAAERGAVTGRTAFLAAGQGDSAAQEVVDWYIAHLTTGLANIINIFQPQVLCIGVGVGNEGENLLAPLRKLTMSEQYARTTTERTSIVSAKLGNDAGIIGAALL